MEMGNFLNREPDMLYSQFLGSAGDFLKNI